MEKLQGVAEQVRAEGWKWVETALSFPWGHTRHLAEIDGTPVVLLEEDAARLTALRSEQETIEAEYARADEFPEDVDIRLGEIEQALETLEERPVSFDPTDMARAAGRHRARPRAAAVAHGVTDFFQPQTEMRLT